MILVVIALMQTASGLPVQAETARAASPVIQSTVTDDVLKQLAIAESRVPSRLYRVIYDDPSMRAEIKRVGFEKGCRAVAESKRQVSRQFVPSLVPATVAAIRKIVPEPHLSEMRPRSFIVGPMRIYTKRIDDEIDRTASPLLMATYAAMRAEFLGRMRELPTSRNPEDNIVMPKTDIAAFGSLNGAYDLDNPAQLGMACADFLIRPEQRPTITTAPSPGTVTIIPPRQ
ncbi:hypothetical protein MOK15_04385 [Sphingobium sp. BYY-5]|uniref:hypothetical protein n=1 Tax=Sphingobium sp. BYY-5 TaxID=2926400 RepID=UPI001FA6D7E2|nr:hypothetical protein [Sphingobium sp. BYY-5]MCI4589334.1 hypothetical protein [Sphingobium sp. BYY-5]